MVLCALNCVCCATNHSQGSVNSPHSFCSFILQTWPKKGCKHLPTWMAGFSSDEAPRVEFPSSGTDQEVSHVSDEAQRKRSVSR